MPYIGRDLNRGNYLKLDDISSSFNSSTKTFNLTVGGSAFTPGSAFSILVSLGGVIQEPESAYQVSNSEITFANAPTEQDSFFCIALGVALGIGVPGNGTVNGTQMSKPFNYDGYFYLDDTNNRVGIGSLIPTSTLDIIGDVKVSGNITGIGGTLGGTLNGNVHGTSGISTFYDLKVINNLTVEGTTTTLDTVVTQVDKLEVAADNTTVGVAITQSGSGDILNLYDGSTEVFTVEDGGNVGIGTNDPETLLHLHSSSPILKIEDVTSNLNQFTRLLQAGAGFRVQLRSGSNDGTLTVQGYGNNTTTDFIRVENDGKVGINSSSPSEKLDVIGNIKSTGTITGSSFSGGLPITDGANNRVITATSASAIQGEAGLTFDGATLINAGSGFKEIAVSCSTDNSATLRLQNNQKNFSISNVTGGKIAISDGSSQRFVIDGSGNVGIGSTIPVNKLDVSGDVSVSDDVIVGDEIRNNVANDFWASDNTFINLNGHGNLTHMGGFETNLTSNGYRDTNGQWVSYNTNSKDGAAQIGLKPEGSIVFRTDASKADGTTHNPTTRLIIDDEGVRPQGGTLNLKNSGSTGNVTINVLGVSGDSRIDLENTGNGNYSGIDFVRERSTGTGVVGGSIFMKSDTSTNDAYLYLQAQSASAQSPVTTALSADNGVRLILKGGDGIFSVETGASERLRIDHNGNVGIGYTDPNAKLHIASGTNSAVGDETNPALQIGSTVNYRFAVHTTNEQAIIANKNGDDGIAFHTKTADGGSFGEAVRIASDGSALFGGLTSQNAQDTSKLAVQGGGSNIGILQVHAGSGETDGDLSGIAFSHGNDDTTARAKAAIALRAIGSYGKGDLCFYVDSANDNEQVAADDEKLRIKSTGQLNIAGNMQFTVGNPELEFNNGGPRFRVPAANTLAIHNGGTLGSDNNEVIRIKSDGNVGIGESNPTSKLVVEGQVVINNSNLIVDKHHIDGTDDWAAASHQLHHKRTFTHNTWTNIFKFYRTTTSADNNAVGTYGGSLHISYIYDRENTVHATGYDVFPFVVRARSSSNLSGNFASQIINLEEIIGATVEVRFTNATTNQIDVQVKFFRSDEENDSPIENLVHAWIDGGGVASNSSRFLYPSILT